MTDPSSACSEPRRDRMALFRGGAGRANSAAATARRGDDQRTSGHGRAALLLAGIWVLGLVALGAVIRFERRVDSARQAQVVIAQMHIQQGDLLAIAFAPATAAKTSTDTRARTRRELSAAKHVLTDSVSEARRLRPQQRPGDDRGTRSTVLHVRRPSFGTGRCTALRSKPPSSTERANSRAESSTA